MDRSIASAFFLFALVMIRTYNLWHVLACASCRAIQEIHWIVGPGFKSCSPEELLCQDRTLLEDTMVVMLYIAFASSVLYVILGLVCIVIVLLCWLQLISEDYGRKIRALFL